MKTWEKTLKYFVIACLFINKCFTSLAWAEFNPPSDITIERTWTMVVQGESVGMLRGEAQAVTVDGKILVKNRIGGMVGIAPGVQLNSVETVWVGPDGVEIFKGTFQETGSPDKITIDAKLSDDIFTFDLVMKPGDPVHSEGFVKDLDYHWSTAYMDVGRQGFKKGEPFEKKILDIYALKSKVVKGLYMGTETVKQGGHSFQCSKIKFDYGDVKGVFWMARDELGWFLVKEEAETEGTPFQMYLDEYTRKKKKAVTEKADNKNKKDFGF